MIPAALAVGRCRMTTYTPELGDRITALLAEFKLSSAAEQPQLPCSSMMLASLGRSEAGIRSWSSRRLAAPRSAARHGQGQRVDVKARRPPDIELRLQAERGGHRVA